MNLETLAAVASIFGSFLVVTAVVFGILQLKHFQEQRRAIAAAEVVHSFKDAQFNRALRMIWGLPDGLSAEGLRARGAEHEDAAILIGTTLETVGVLVYQRIAPLGVVDELMGDAIILLWRKLEPWVLVLRREQGRESVYEWFQWLADRLGERERRTTQGAHVTFRDWRP